VGTSPDPVLFSAQVLLFLSSITVSKKSFNIHKQSTDSYIFYLTDLTTLLLKQITTESHKIAAINNLILISLSQLKQTSLHPPWLKGTICHLVFFAEHLNNFLVT
jgi:hypothetical protein